MVCLAALGCGLAPAAGCGIAAPANKLALGPRAGLAIGFEAGLVWAFARRCFAALAFGPIHALRCIRRTGFAPGRVATVQTGFAFCGFARGKFSGARFTLTRFSVASFTSIGSIPKFTLRLAGAVTAILAIGRAVFGPAVACGFVAACVFGAGGIGPDGFGFALCGAVCALAVVVPIGLAGLAFGLVIASLTRCAIFGRIPILFLRGLRGASAR